jgi:hypothetical protein
MSVGQREIKLKHRLLPRRRDECYTNGINTFGRTGKLQFLVGPFVVIVVFIIIERDRGTLLQESSSRCTAEVGY